MFPGLLLVPVVLLWTSAAVDAHSQCRKCSQPASTPSTPPAMCPPLNGLFAIYNEKTGQTEPTALGAGQQPAGTSVNITCTGSESDTAMLFSGGSAVGADQCSSIAPLDRVECGFCGINQDTCLERGCCYIPSDVIDPNTGAPVNWCFKPLVFETCVYQNINNYRDSTTNDNEINTVVCGTDGYWAVQDAPAANYKLSSDSGSITCFDGDSGSVFCLNPIDQCPSLPGMFTNVDGKTAQVDTSGNYNGPQSVGTSLTISCTGGTTAILFKSADKICAFQDSDNIAMGNEQATLVCSSAFQWVLQGSPADGLKLINTPEAITCGGETQTCPPDGYPC